MTELKETPEVSQEAKEFQMTDRGKSAMQGVPAPSGSDTSTQDAPAAQDAKSVSDTTFTDHQGRNIDIRTYPSGDSAYIRAYDTQRKPELPATPQVSDVGQANLHLEKDVNGNVERARLQDINISNPQYRGSGIGSKMLEDSEAYAKKSNAKEIYGVFSPDSGEEQQTRQWYARHGYGFRPGQSGGEEVFKSLL
jgi:GNAT superfamily N-acetyltransferase